MGINYKYPYTRTSNMSFEEIRIDTLCIKNKQK